MDPLTHLLLTWLITIPFALKSRDIRIVVISGLVADVDGFLMFYSWRVFGQYHRAFTHNYFLFLAFLIIAIILASERKKVAGLVFMGFSMHLVADYFTTIVSFRPFFPIFTASISFCPFVPPGFIILFIDPVYISILLALTLYVIYTMGRSPAELISQRMNRLVVGIFVYPGKYKCKECGMKAYYCCEECKNYYCDKHSGGLFSYRCKGCKSKDGKKNS